MNHALASVTAAQRGGSSYGGRGRHCVLWEAKGLGIPPGLGAESRRKQTLERGGGCMLLEVKFEVQSPATSSDGDGALASRPSPLMSVCDRLYPA